MFFPTISFIGYTAGRIQGQLLDLQYRPQKSDEHVFVFLSMTVQAASASVYLLTLTLRNCLSIIGDVRLEPYFACLIINYILLHPAGHGYKKDPLEQILASLGKHVSEIIIKLTAVALLVNCLTQASLLQTITTFYGSCLPLLGLLFISYQLGLFMANPQAFLVSSKLLPHETSLPLLRQTVQPRLAVLCLSICLIPFLIQQTLTSSAIPLYGSGLTKWAGRLMEASTLIYLINHQLHSLWGVLEGKICNTKQILL